MVARVRRAVWRVPVHAAGVDGGRAAGLGARVVRHPAAEGAAHAGDIIPGIYGEQAEERAGPAQVPERVARRIAAQQARQGGGFLLHPRLRVPPERRRVLRHGLHGVERHEHVRLHRGDAALLALLQARRPGDGGVRGGDGNRARQQAQVRGSPDA